MKSSSGDDEGGLERSWFRCINSPATVCLSKEVGETDYGHPHCNVFTNYRKKDVIILRAPNIHKYIN